MQTIRVTTAFHDTTRLLVHNLHLSVDDYIFIIFLEHSICFQQLVDGMYTFRLDGIVGHQSILLGQTLFVGQVFFILQGRELGCDIRQNKEGWVFGVTGNQVDTFICQVYTVQLFIDNEIQRIGNFVHTFVVLLHVDLFCLEHSGLDTLFAKELDQCFVLGQTLVAAVQSKEAFFLIFLIIGSNQTLGLGKIFGCQYFLCFYQAFNQRTELFEQLIVTFGYRTRDDQRSSCIINQYGVYLIDDGVVVLALNEIFRTDGHVVTQVVETKFVVGTESDICHISLTACVRVGTMFVDTVYAQSVEHVQRSHPFRVTFRQVVVYSNDMYSVSCQCIEEYG
ncbi:uncharacterized protein BN744_00881 [Bacteroides sp. CAG:633]|nr:uncharacterized protein BN744_00881 [Bacteroides sp. CAG:633]